MILRQCNAHLADCPHRTRSVMPPSMPISAIRMNGMPVMRITGSMPCMLNDRISPRASQTPLRTTCINTARRTVTDVRTGCNSPLVRDAITITPEAEYRLPRHHFFQRQARRRLLAFAQQPIVDQYRAFGLVARIYIAANRQRDRKSVV